MEPRNALTAFGRDPEGLQKLVGLTIAGGSFVIAVVNFTSVTLSISRPPLAALLQVNVSVLLLFTVLGIISGFWKSKIARTLHVLIFFATSVLNTSSVQPGDLTSSIFLTFGLILIVEYQLGRWTAVIGALFALTIYPAGLALGLRHNSPSFLASTADDLIGVMIFIGLYGGVLYRHWLRHRDEASLLETRVKERTAELERALSERVVMLQEIHHRVKNNLQIVASLLELEVGKIESRKDRKPLEASIQRVHAMALVHETLYDSEHLQNVDLSDYTRKLVDAVQQASPSHAEIELTIKSGAKVGLNFAVPFGLLVNELVSNALTHAFPGDAHGKVHVVLESDGAVVLRVVDDGVGFPESFRLEEVESLGLTIVRSLVEQLGGELLLDRAHGAAWTVNLPK